MRRHDPTRTGRVVGAVAFSELETRGVGKPTRVRFVEELFVLPGYRKQGVASCLINRALLLHRSGGRYRKTDRVACVVRRHAQQAAAEAMYEKMGMRPVPVRRHLVDRALRPVPIQPKYSGGPDDELESYWEGYEKRAVPDHYNLNVAPFRVPPGPPVPAADFVQSNRPFMRELKRCHDPRHGGDGADPYEVVAAADWVFAAYAC